MVGTRRGGGFVVSLDTKRDDEQALVSLKIKETVDAGVGRTKAAIIEDD